MSSTAVSEERQALGILAAYKQRVIDQLYSDMLEEIKPKLREAAQIAVKEMEPSIQTYIDHMHNTMHIQLSVKGLEGGD